MERGSGWKWARRGRVRSRRESRRVRRGVEGNGKKRRGEGMGKVRVRRRAKEREGIRVREWSEERGQD